MCQFAAVWFALADAFEILIRLSWLELAIVLARYCGFLGRVLRWRLRVFSSLCNWLSFFAESLTMRFGEIFQRIRLLTLLLMQHERKW